MGLISRVSSRTYRLNIKKYIYSIMVNIDQSLEAIVKQNKASRRGSRGKQGSSGPPKRLRRVAKSTSPRKGRNVFSRDRSRSNPRSRARSASNGRGGQGG